MLQLLTDIDMIHFFERALRGGIFQVSTKYACPNSIHSTTYNSEKPSEKIYLDANGLYSFAMTSKLATGDFKWIENLDNLQIGANQSKSCF